MFKEDRATAMASYFVAKAGGGIPYIKLMKLMYFAEREWLLFSGATMLGDSFFSMDNGPVLSYVWDCMNRKSQNRSSGRGGIWNKFLSTVSDGCIKELSMLDGQSMFTPPQQRVLDSVWNNYGLSQVAGMEKTKRQFFCPDTI